MDNKVIKSENELAEKVDKLIREIIDDHSYKGSLIRDLSRKKLLKVVTILTVYSKLIENNIK